MDFVCAPARELPPPLYDALAKYRFQIFVQRLGWALRSAHGYEQDEFDDVNTVHLVARDALGQVVGCGRLLPTTGPYLLEQVFPQLLNGMPVPRSDKVWELSRFAATPAAALSAAAGPNYLAERMLLQALRCCQAMGVTHLLAVSTPPVELLLRRAGVDSQRLGPPVMFSGRPVLAFVIAVNRTSVQSLSAFERAALVDCRVARPSRCEGTAVLRSLASLPQAHCPSAAVLAAAEAAPFSAAACH
jgi:acyl homoserine lactone synthase